MSEDGPDDVGSIGEEAMKLFGALADMARQQGGEAAGAMGGLAGQAAAMAHELNEHIATDGAECRYCPVCRVVHAVRQTSPEVKTHLMVAASSLLQAAAGLMDTLPPPGGDAPARGPEVERIDLDDVEDDVDPSDEPGTTT
ncbi:MAG TPA: hypothetical protein VNS81_06770 [Nocardioides sp.]|nr:hypothetical protein [Nocardioides sp.]